MAEPGFLLVMEPEPRGIVEHATLQSRMLDGPRSRASNPVDGVLRRAAGLDQQARRHHSHPSLPILAMDRDFAAITQDVHQLAPQSAPSFLETKIG